MKKIIVKQFGRPEVLQVQELNTPEPGPGQVRVAMTSIGMNHADLMARRGEYIISSGHPPFTPGIEGGGVIDAVGPHVTNRKVGQRVLLGADAPKRNNNPTSNFLAGGTYSSHYIVPADQTVLAPKALPDMQLGAIWLPYLTAWGCLVWKQRIKPGEFVAIPAASSSVGLAAAQIVKKQGGVAIGLTSNVAKAELIKSLPESRFDHIVVTQKHGKTQPWYRDLRKITNRHGVDVFFDPVAAGEYLQMEIQSLASHGTIWIYGLLGQTGPVDVTPLIRRFASIRGWYLNELTEEAGEPALSEGYTYILKGFEDGSFQQRVAKTFSLDEVKQAHEEFALGRHIGKFILIPN